MTRAGASRIPQGGSRPRADDDGQGAEAGEPDHLDRGHAEGRHAPHRLGHDARQHSVHGRLAAQARSRIGSRTCCHGGASWQRLAAVCSCVRTSLPVSDEIESLVRRSSSSLSPRPPPALAQGPGRTAPDPTIVIDGSPAPEPPESDHARRPSARDGSRHQARPSRCGSTASSTKRSTATKRRSAASSRWRRSTAPESTETTDVWITYDENNIYVVGALLGLGAAGAVDRERAAPRHQPAAPERSLRRDVRHVLRSPQRLHVLHQPARRAGRLFGRRRRAVEHRLESGVESRTGTFEGGWTVEMAIPFKTLRYRSGHDQVWGIQLRRAIRHKNEWTYLTPVPQNLAGPQAFNRISSGGTLVGLDLPPASRNLEVKPYAISRCPTDSLACRRRRQRLRSGPRRRREVRRDGQPDRRLHRSTPTSPRSRSTSSRSTSRASACSFPRSVTSFSRAAACSTSPAAAPARRWRRDRQRAQPIRRTCSTAGASGSTPTA